MNILRWTASAAVLLLLFAVQSHAQWKRTDTLCHGNITSLVSLNGTIFAASNNGIHRSTDHGTHWTRSDTGITMNIITALGELNGTIFAGTQTEGIYISSDTGATWSNASGGLTMLNVTAFLPVPYGAVGQRAMYACFSDTNNHGGVYRSAQAGTSWVHADSGITSTDVRSLSVCGNELFAGTMNGVFRSADAGTSWVPKNTGLTVPYVVALHSCGAQLFAGTIAGGAYRTTNSGDQWVRINEGLTNTYVNAFTEAADHRLFAGTGWSGVFFSTDHGSTWKQANEGLTTSQINSLMMDAAGTEVFAGTDDGVWRRPVSEFTTGVMTDGSTVPVGPELQQNFPNPFNPATTIRYTLPGTAHVLLTVSNDIGQRVSVLVDESRSAGRYEVRWNAEGMPSGVYVYTLTAGAYRLSKRMTVIR